MRRRTPFTMPDLAQETGESLTQQPSPQDAEAEQETTSQRDFEGNSFGLRGLTTRGSAARSLGERISEPQRGLTHEPTLDRARSCHHPEPFDLNQEQLELLEPWQRRILRESKQTVEDAKEFLRNEAGDSDSESDRLAMSLRLARCQNGEGKSCEPESVVPEIGALSFRPSASSR